MRWVILVIVAATLQGCSPSKVAAAKEAEDHYRFVEKNRGSHSELCEAAKAARDAQAEAKNETAYGMWQSTVDLDCKG